MKKIFNAAKANIWKTLTVIVTIFSVIGGVWAFENRYALKKEIEPIIIAQKDIQVSQQEFHKQQQNLTTRQDLLIKQQKLQIINTKREFYQMLLDDTNKDLADARTYLRNHPEDDWARDRISELEVSKRRLQEKIDALIREINSIGIIE